MSKTATENDTDTDAQRRIAPVVSCDDNFGANQLLKNIAPQSHMIDIRVRLNGDYYWFEGNFLKQIFPHVQFNQINNDGIKTTLESHKQIDS